MIYSDDHCPVKLIFGPLESILSSSPKSTSSALFANSSFSASLLALFDPQIKQATAKHASMAAKMKKLMALSVYDGCFGITSGVASSTKLP